MIRLKSLSSDQEGQHDRNDTCQQGCSGKDDLQADTKREQRLLSFLSFLSAGQGHTGGFQGFWRLRICAASFLLAIPASIVGYPRGCLKRASSSDSLAGQRSVFGSSELLRGPTHGNHQERKKHEMFEEIRCIIRISEALGPKRPRVLERARSRIKPGSGSRSLASWPTFARQRARTSVSTSSHKMSLSHNWRMGKSDRILSSAMLLS